MSCKTDKDFKRFFPNHKIASLERMQRKFKQNGNHKSQDPKEEMINRAREKEIRKLRKRNTLYEIVGEQLLESTKAIPAGEVPKKIKTNNKNFDEEEMCTLFSDCHVGLTVDSKQSGGLGMYNPEIFKEEMEFLRKSQEKVFDLHSNVPYNTMNIFMLGDIIENRIMREAQLRLTEINIVQQVMEAVNEISLWVAWLSRHFNEVNIYCVVGNHGRLTSKIGVLSPSDSFDYLVYKWMKERLKDHSNVKFNISESWWMAVERMGVKFYLEHGEEFRSWAGIPFYGLKRGKANMRELLSQYLDEKGRKMDFDLFCVG
ncbi:MAG: hypothetical protein ACOC5T_08535, partial [Elusimicrobiota bacterium]